MRLIPQITLCPWDNWKPTVVLHLKPFTQQTLPDVCFIASPGELVWKSVTLQGQNKMKPTHCCTIIYRWPYNSAAARATKPGQRTCICSCMLSDVVVNEIRHKTCSQVSISAAVWCSKIQQQQINTAEVMALWAFFSSISVDQLLDSTRGKHLLTMLSLWSMTSLAISSSKCSCSS